MKLKYTLGNGDTNTPHLTLCLVSETNLKRAKSKREELTDEKNHCSLGR